MTLRFLDIYLPGPNGFDLKIWRVYNSKILKDRLSGSAWGIQQEPYSWVGMGWTMHMGRVHNFDTDTPVIEFPDGRWETAYLKTGSSAYVTRDFLKYDKDNYKLYFKDGTVWIFGEQKTIKYGDSEEYVRVVTRIENSFGHHIDITYHTGSVPTITKITDSMQREVNFETEGSTNPKLTRIYVKDAHGNISYYYYTVGTFSYGGYYQLTAYDPPELTAATYEYYSGQYDRYELTTVNTSFGGEMKYEYGDHTFYFYEQDLDTRVVNKKEIKFSSSSSYKTWNYTYPDYDNTTTGTVSIDGPDFDTEVTYHAYDSAALWKIGLLKNKSFTDGSYSEGHEWLPQVISSKHWYVLSIDMGYATAPLISKVIRTRKGDAESEEWYLYERSSVKDYGLPTKIRYYANDSLKSYKTLEYYFETSTTFEDNYMLSHIWKEKDYSSGGTKLKETQTTYFDTSGVCGAIDEIKRLKSGSAYYTWDYTYTSTYPNPYEITITVNLPGSAGTETYEYRYGVLSKIVRPGYTELIRTISTHDSSILTETNQHGGTMDFTYDGLGRIEEIDMPSVFNDINAVWSTNSVTITQGGNTVVKYWDGMGRDMGYEETGDGVTLYYRKTLDSEGRVIAENKGSTSSSDKYIYELTASGQVKKITDPRGKIINISYSGDKKTLTDPESNVTEFEYTDLPGLMAKLKDAEARYADYIYDGIGRLAEVKYNNSRTQNFSYNGLDSLTEETHPETGTIEYTYNTENNLSTKNWGGTEINYSYNSSNQLTSTNSGDETVTYSYDSNGRVKKISSNKGWYRDNIQYNSLGSITSERQYIPGLGAKTLTYTYDNNNNLDSIAYPDGRTVSYTNNGLNMPETANFNAKSLISQMTYSVNKQPAYMNISGNSTEFNAAYNSSGFLSSASLKKSGNVLYNSSYEYDGVGNITSISNTTPNLGASFGYDSLNRLTSAAYTPSGVGRVDDFSYTYDEYGNMKTVKEGVNTIFSKTYNSQNQISGYNYDTRGNLTSDSNYQYVWDNQNRLGEVKNAGGASLGSYLYDERGLRLKATKEPLPPSLPEINVKQGTTNIPDGGSFNFGSGEVGTNTDKAFTIENTGDGDLTLSGSPIIQISGTHADQFSVQQQPTSPVSPGNSTSFIIRFSPTSEGSKTASISIANNDSNENPYDITLNGTGYDPEPPDPKPPKPIIPDSVDPVRDLSSNDSSQASQVPEAPLTVNFPNDREQLRSGSLQNITWLSDDSIRDVKIEYSIDNGSTYQTIVERATNTGTYQWEVPQEISRSCLIRISNADGLPSIPELFTFEFKFKISRPQNAFQWYPDFVVSLGVPDEKAMSSKFADLSFIPDETNGYEDIMFNYNMAESLNLELFLEKWHYVKIQLDMSNYSGSVWLDDQLIFEDILLETDINFKSSSEISMSCNRDVPVRIWIEDLRVEMKDPNFRPQDETAEKLMFLESIVIDNFDIYTSGEFPEQGGWSIVQRNIRREEFRDKDIFIDSQNRRFSVTGEGFLAERNYYIIDNKEFVSGTKSFKLESSDDSPARVVKRFSLPARVPFDIIDGNFAIVAESFEGDGDRHEQDFKYRELEMKKRIWEQEEDGYTREYLSGAHEAHNNIPESSLMSDGNVEEQNNSEITNSIRALSGSPESTYYIYSFDGKLLAEYNTDGVCVREYIYMGNQLMAEYKPQETKYYYYTSDQVNSTRIVTNDSGTVVYSAAYDPYGGIQKTWENTYDPKLKFSGKERDNDSGLDYFGARYYGHKSYRFNSVDPIITREKALSDPQLWNLYSYCRNNPITFLDPDGRELRTTQIETMREIAGPAASMIIIVEGKLDVSGLTENAMSNNEGATLLYQLATSNYVYSYSEGATGGVSNLDNRPDWRFPNGKSSRFLPHPGVDCAVVIDPSIKYVDKATGTLNVSNAAIAFHELAEAYAKVDLGMPYMQRGGGAGAHENARQRERTLIRQRPGFTQYPAGETLRRK